MPARLSNVDALRGLAALWVFAYHLWNVFAPGFSPQGSPADHKPLAEASVGVAVTYPVCAYGYTGVGLFFVLSGFCIHLPQARRFHTTGSDALEPRPFFYRRLKRLYPAFFASLFLAAVGLWAMTSTLPDATPLSLATIGVFVLVNACFLLAVQPQALGLNGVYWTLWYEVQFYLAYPLLLKLCRRVGFGGVAVGLLVIELLFTFVPTPEVLKPLAPHFEWLFLRRYFEWFLGMWLAERVANGLHLPRGVSLAVAMGAAAMGVASSHIPELWAGHELWLAVASAGVLSLLVSPRSEPSPGTLAAGGRGVMAWCGDWSYSLYLIHMPMLRLVFAGEALLPDEWRLNGSFYAAGAAAVAVVPAAAWVWYRLFEKPFLPKPTKTVAGVCDPGQTGLTEAGYNKPSTRSEITSSLPMPMSKPSSPSANQSHC